MSRPPSWTDWLPVFAWVGAGALSILAAPQIAIDTDSAAVGVGFAFVGLVCLFVSLWPLRRVVVMRVNWMADQQIAELRRRQAEGGAGVQDPENQP
jgi:hypothetical protein